MLRFGKEEVLREVCVTYSYEYEKNKRDTSGEDFNDGCSRSATHIILLDHGAPTRVPSGCIMRPAATFVDCIYTIKIQNNLGRRLYHRLLFSHVRPTNQPTIRGVERCRKNLEAHALQQD